MSIFPCVSLRWAMKTFSLSLVTLLVACGASPGTPATAPPPTVSATARLLADLCTVLTAVQLRQITGIAFNPLISAPVETAQPGVTQSATCTATTVATTGGMADGTLTFTLLIFPTPTDAAIFYAQQRAAATQAALVVTDLIGVGDQAFTIAGTSTPGVKLIAVQGIIELQLSLTLHMQTADEMADAQLLANFLFAHV